ncbi:MAG: hypothetical protein ACAH80_13760 [Alphaproteobacteria bacterium]
MNELKKVFNKTSAPVEKALFKAKLGLLEHGGHVADDTFAKAVTRARADFGVEESAFRDAFGLSSGAVARWSNGKNLPHPMVRPKILAWLRHQI